MKKHKLQLKGEVKNANSDVIIFVSKQRGRRLKFPIDTPEEEYPKFKKLGFNIFRCSGCKSEDCFGDCGEDINQKIKDKYTTKEEKQEQKLKEEFENKPTVQDLVKLFDGNSVEKEEPKEEVTPSDTKPVTNYEDFTLKELREMFPNIKSVSKQGFIAQIPDK